MSAGSAFASGVRSGQAIWNSAVNNAMAGKRLDMLKTQFQFEQAQRKKSLDNELASESTYDKFTEYLAAASSSGEINFSTPEGREMYSDLKTSVEPNISRDPATWKRYESFSKEFEIKEGFPVYEAQKRNRLLTIENYKTVSGEDNPLYKRDKDNNFILTPDGETQLDMPSMNNFIEEDALKKDVTKKKRLQEAMYGGSAFESMVISGAPTAGMPKELQAQVIVARQKRWASAVKSNDTDTVIGASNVHSKAPDGTERQTLGKYKFTLARLGELKEQLKVVGDTGPIVGIFRGANPWDVKARLLQSQITKIIPGLARGVFGEVGVLTDQDVALYSKTLGTLTSPEEINELLTSAAIKMVSNSYEDKLRGMAESKINVSGFLPGLVDLRNTANKLLGTEDEEPAAIEVESFTRDGNTVSISDADAARIEAAAGGAKTISVREAGTENIIKINVRGNSPTEETPPAPTSEPVAAPAPRPDKPIEDFNVWSGKHLEDFPPLDEAEAKKVSPNRRKWEARIELYETRLAELVAAKRGRISQTADEKKLRTAIAKAEAALKKL
jgi:hypothetical protein